MFLAESPERVFKETGGRLHLGVFGKHPAWDDHMEDFGLATSSLVEFKRRFYLDGISTCIDSGAWLNLPPEEVFEDFDNELIWCGETGIIFAIAWATSDGRGRRIYPMVAAAHFLTSRLPVSVGPVFEALHAVAAACRETSTREGVRFAQAAGVEKLIAAARSQVPLSADAWDGSLREAFCDAPAFAPERCGLMRVFHAVQSNLDVDKPQALRMATASDPREDLMIWQVLLRSQMGRSVPLLTLRHRQADWIDALEGDFTPTDFARLKVRSGEIPCTTSIPYQMDPQLTDSASIVLDSFISDPCRIPRLDACGSDGPGQTTLGSLIGRLFRPSGS